MGFDFFKIFENSKYILKIRNIFWRFILNFFKKYILRFYSYILKIHNIFWESQIYFENLKYILRIPNIFWTSSIFFKNIPHSRITFWNLRLFRYLISFEAIAERHLYNFIYKTCTHDSENKCLFRTHTCFFREKNAKIEEMKRFNYLKKIFFYITCGCFMCNNLIQNK